MAAGDGVLVVVVWLVVERVDEPDFAVPVLAPGLVVVGGRAGVVVRVGVVGAGLDVGRWGLVVVGLVGVGVGVVGVVRVAVEVELV
ncbi:MAG: hypothetical protein QOF83_3033 [Solirubrobacteraceae bacterium]|jgi:hypothetical protein|nr:hypothetical protein [Solirubrobacteraceae bacterium]